jgi:hypothetical protein
MACTLEIYASRPRPAIAEAVQHCKALVGKGVGQEYHALSFILVLAVEQKRPGPHY